MKKEMTFVLALIVLISGFAIIGNIPLNDQISGKFSVNFSPEESTDHYYNVYGNVFEFKGGEGVITKLSNGEQYRVNFIKSNTEQFGTSSKLVEEKVVLSIEKSHRADEDLRPYEINKGKINLIRGELEIFLVNLFDDYGLDKDRATISFPNAVSIIYKANMENGEIRLVNDNRIELIEYTSSNFLNREGIVKLKVNNKESTISESDGIKEINGLRIAIEDSTNINQVRLNIFNVDKVKLENSIRMK